MDSHELKQIIARLRAQGTDDAAVEVKSCAAKLSSSVWDSVSAFGNTNGGLIILGLDENNGFKPVPRFDIDRVLDQFVTGMGDGGDMNGALVNPPQYEIQRIAFEGAFILVAEIAEVEPRFKPCYLKKRDMANGAYKRVDDKDIKLSPAEIFALQHVLEVSPADRGIVPEATTADLDERVIFSLIERKLFQDSKALKNTRSKEEQLTRLNITNAQGEIRLAGLLAAGVYPQQFYPKLVVDVAVHPGTRKSAPGEMRFLDRVVCEGSLGEMIPDAVKAVVRNIRTHSIVQGTGRKDVLEIPEEALREAIANAVIHREYAAAYTGQSVSVDIFADRVEVANPGGLWGGKTLRNLDDGTSRCRNETLMKLASDIPLFDGAGMPAEGQGSGIALIKRSMEDQGLEPPEFVAGIDLFKVVFHRKTAGALVSVSPRGATAAKRPKAADAIMTAVSEGAPLSAKDIASLTGIKIATVRANLKKMVDEGLLRPTAAENNPHRKYVLVNS